jgi:cell division protein FtsQ
MKRWKIALWNFSQWLMVITYLVVALSFASNKAEMAVCSSIDINIADSLNNAFVTKSDVLKTLEREHSNFIGIPLSMINTHILEQQIKAMQAVKGAEVYKTAEGKLAINIEQRKPIVRIINRQGQSYYIDVEGRTLPLSSKFTSHVLIINGNITEPFNIEPNIEVLKWTGKNITNESPLICQLYDFAKFIVNDPFWRAQITQIYVDNPNSIELIPRVGPHTVILGNLDEYRTKLAKLKLFYERALPEEGWNKYKEINLKFKNQIVCTKR